ncbi:hypothetical protein [Paenibacillus gansuensis]|uniref:UDP-N-acetylmuramyl pentapeptide phosphotransferase/UDP-N-acetylglucosamine-1-phosphate transferase n=1 Tax=Paenibacillus gansuensis TaxID=306542 RepID=A0ABW5P9M5_9BACL
MAVSVAHGTLTLIGAGALTASSGRWLLPRTAAFLSGHGIVRLNYRQEQIPTAAGVLVAVLTLLYGLTLPLWDKYVPAFSLLPADRLPWLQAYTSASAGVALIGWLDDTAGDREIKGLRGHFREYRKRGIVTTGMLKAAGTCILALATACFGGGSMVRILLGWGVIVLSTNTVNLLDLRPGRAIKSYVMLLLILLAFTAETRMALVAQLPALAGALLLFRPDLQGRLMLGDTGANSLGFAVGSACALTAPTGVLAAWALALLALHAAAERISLSVWIERRPVLRWLDRWGRPL